MNVVRTKSWMGTLKGTYTLETASTPRLRCSFECINGFGWSVLHYNVLQCLMYNARVEGRFTRVIRKSRCIHRALRTVSLPRKLAMNIINTVAFIMLLCFGEKNHAPSL